MKDTLLELLVCPSCKNTLKPQAGHFIDNEIISGILKCDDCSCTYPIKNGIPRFVPAENYANNFGLQWNRFSKTQLDSNSRLPISKQRLFDSTGWDWAAMKGKRVLDVGCGSGRFAEVALQAGADVVAIDYSSAVDAARANLSSYKNFEVIQASVFDLPFRAGSFDYVYCLGVLQHTPDPAKAFAALPAQLRAGGRLAVDVYPFLLRNILWSKYWLRPITKRMSGPALMQMVERAVPSLLTVSRCVSAIPVVGKKLKYLLPVANYEGVYNLSESQLKEWAILDTFDMLSPEHDHPKSARTLAHWFDDAGLVGVQVFRKGHLIGRGEKPE
ncbi:MAG: methyltransferase domain-containing protein [Pseudomonadota bacterium]